MDDGVLIVGGGLTGLSTALHLPASVQWQLFEKDARPGGHARTELRDGFYFDKTGHWLHLRDPGIMSLVDELFPGDRASHSLTKVARKARIFSSGVLSRYPFQANLFGLPPSVISECLLGFIEAQSDPRSMEPAQNFADFCDKRFGKGISRHFMLPYNRKLWGVDPSEITAAWCSRFVPIPKLADVVKGAVGDTPPELGYNAHFLYPREGGIETLVHRIVDRLPQDRLHKGAALESVELATKTAIVGGERHHFSAMVATLPLPELCRRIVDLPSHLQPFVDALRCTPVRYLNVATKVPPRSDYHWLYVPEDKYPFYRIGVYSNAVPSMAPSGCGSFYVELSSRGPIDEAKLVPEVLDSLVAAGVLHRKEDLLFADLREIEYAYVVFDDNYYPALAALVPFLEQHGIYPRGRYGSWTYNSMEDCLMLGRDIAAQLTNPSGLLKKK